MSTLTLKNVPDDVVEQIARLARTTRRSMSSAAVAALRRGIATPAPKIRTRDLASFAGSWDKKDFAAFEKATAAFGDIDKELWKK